MKRVTFIALALALTLVPGCKNQNNKNAKENGEKTETLAEKYARKELQINAENLLESVKKLKPVSFAKADEEGNIVLSEQEKKNQPDYLLDPSYTNNLISTKQKYRAIAMLNVDKTIAEMYDMKVNVYDAAITKLAIEINDNALKEFADVPVEKIDLGKLLDEEYEAGRPNLFWEAAAASFVEQIFIVTRDIDKFMPMFTDENASEITWNFVCVHEGIRQMVENYPEMESLNEVLDPLYAINAINVEQLRSQLMEVKEDIEVCREFLTK